MSHHSTDMIETLKALADYDRTKPDQDGGEGWAEWLEAHPEVKAEQERLRNG